MEILIITHTFINNKNQIICNNLKAKGINITFTNEIIKINLDDFSLYKYNLIFYNLNINNETSLHKNIVHKYNIKEYINFSNVIKHIINYNNNNSIKEKLNILENLCNGLDGLIISCGPSSKNIDFDFLKEFQNNIIIVSIKQIIKLLIDNNIHSDFNIFSSWVSNDEFNINNCKNKYDKLGVSLCALKPDINKYLFDINLKNSNIYHNMTFKLINDTKNINIIKFNDKKIRNNYLYFNCANIMLEIAIPLLIHLGIKNIFTYGWDGPINNQYTYFNNDINNTFNNNCMSEYTNMTSIKQMLNNNNINVYKCSEKSPIDLPFKYFDNIN
jgi:hypothetical protein